MSLFGGKAKRGQLRDKGRSATVDSSKPSASRASLADLKAELIVFIKKQVCFEVARYMSESTGSPWDDFEGEIGSPDVLSGGEEDGEAGSFHSWSDLKGTTDDASNGEGEQPRPEVLQTWVQQHQTHSRRRAERHLYRKLAELEHQLDAARAVQDAAHAASVQSLCAQLQRQLRKVRKERARLVSHEPCICADFPYKHKTSEQPIHTPSESNSSSGEHACREQSAEKAFTAVDIPAHTTTPIHTARRLTVSNEDAETIRHIPVNNETKPESPEAANFETVTTTSVQVHIVDYGESSTRQDALGTVASAGETEPKSENEAKYATMSPRRKYFLSSGAKSLPTLPLSPKSKVRVEDPHAKATTIKTSRETDRRLILNVGGKRFETYRSTLVRHPETLLGVMFSPRNEALTSLQVGSQICNHRCNSKTRESDSSDDEMDDLCEYCTDNQLRFKDEYFFDRSFEAFEGIMQYYRTGCILERPLHVPPPIWRTELDYWHMPLVAPVTLAFDDEPTFEGQKAEWWAVFRELHPIKSCLEVKLDAHSITPIHFNRREALLTFIFDQRGELIVGVDGIIIKGSWYARERTQVKSMTFKKIHWDKQEVGQYRIVWNTLHNGDSFPRQASNNAAAVGQILLHS